MRLIAQPDNTNALLIGEKPRMMLANDIALTASWLDDNKHRFGDDFLESTAGALAIKLHQVARQLAADRAAEIYDETAAEVEAEDDIEQARRLVGVAGLGGCAEVEA
jgi:hypothetical protein